MKHFLKWLLGGILEALISAGLGFILFYLMFYVNSL